MDECHGLLVTHEDGRAECLDGDCVEPDAPRHAWRALCLDVPGLCTCAEPAHVHERSARRAA